MATFEEENQEFLRELEAGIVGVYDAHPEMNDHNADKAMNALIRSYEADLKGRRQPTIKLTAVEKIIYTRLRDTCERWMGQQEEGVPQYDKPLVVQCLKRIYKSMHSWTRRHGMRGYLDFVKAFVSGSK